MAKYDAVDRLMSQATAPAPPKEAGPQGGGTSKPGALPVSANDAESVLEARVSAGERGVPPVLPPLEARTEPDTTALATSQVSSGERGRQILGALRPFLPAVSGALRMVDHGAVQAVARLLPLLGSVAAGKAAQPQSAPGVAPEQPSQLAALLAASDKRHKDLAEELNTLKTQGSAQDEQLRRLRDGLERTVAEQGAIAHLAHQLADRSRLLTAVVLILLMLAVTNIILLWIFMHR